MIPPRLLSRLTAIWICVTCIVCWLWLSAHIDWSRKCGPDPRFDYPHLLATCRDMETLRSALILPALVTLLILGLFVVLQVISRSGTPKTRDGFWTSPLAAIGASLCLWGAFFGSIWLHYWRDHQRTCVDTDGPLYHAPYCADVDRILWEFGLASFPPLVAGLALLGIGFVRLRRLSVSR